MNIIPCKNSSSGVAIPPTASEVFFKLGNSNQLVALLAQLLWDWKQVL